MALIRPLERWPPVLCGPMLRRVTPESVCVFVALKRACDVTLDVYEGAQPAAGAAPVASATAATVPFGRNLHARAVVAAPDVPLVPRRTYSYDLTFAFAGGPTLSLGDPRIGLLDGHAPLGYEPGRLPSFALPPDLADLHLLYGSCRKPHGPGPDMLAAVDDLVEADLDDPVARPHQLVLGGDQIYADDVAVSLYYTLAQTGLTLIGSSEMETIPGGGMPVDMNDPSVTPGPARQEFIDEVVRFSGELSAAHLLFLADFYGMYGMVWSDALWPRVVDDAPAGGDTAWPRATEDAAPVLDLPTAEELGILTRDWLARMGPPEDFDEQRANALEFGATLAKVRRALANVPSLMIFDDHEVTDDWFLHRDWDEDVRSSAAGRQAMRNALVAYAVFQDWGNLPESYAEAPGATVLQRARYGQAADRPRLYAEPDALDRILAIQSPSSPALPPDERVHWEHAIEGPQHRILFLDSRTWRQFPDDPKGPPALISPEALDFQLDPYSADGDQVLTLVVAPAPVIGHPLVEEFGQRLAVRWDGPEIRDNEAWAANRAALEGFLRRLARFGSAVLLSGDVHYAFANHVAYFRDDASERARFVQLCSSSMKNQEEKTRAIGYIGWGPLASVGWLGFEDELPNEQALRATLEESTDVEMLRRLFELRVREPLTKPTVIRSDGWVSDQLRGMVNWAAEQTPRTGWRYRITALADTRAREARVIRGGPLVEDDPVRSKAVVGRNNLGRVRFRVAAGAPSEVVHELLWWRELASGPALLSTLHVAPLTLPDPSERPTVSP